MLRLRQVALVARDLPAAEAAITSALGLELCFRDPGVGEFGLRNALYPVGDRFLEVVSPVEEGTTAGRLLDKRGGDGGYMVIFQTDDLDGLRRRLDGAGVRIVYEAKGQGIVGLHLHPKDVGGAIVSVDRSDQPAEWHWAGPQWRDHVRTGVVTDLVGVEVQADDPAATAARWAAVLGRPVTGGTTVEVDDATIAFVEASDGRGPGVAAVHLSAADRSRAGERLELVGTTVRLV
jgi:catechol 2,3-dioxygenase-like lactoylglutathione lyase family enzyme